MIKTKRNVGLLALVFAWGWVGAALAQTAPAATTIDFSPILNPIIQALGIVASVTAIPAMWMGINWIRSKAGLAAIDKDNATRQAVDAGLQKSLGSGISQVRDAVAGLPMTVSIKNQVIAQAATYAQNTMQDTLKAANLDDPNKLAAAIEARLGIMEMQATTGSSAPGITHAVNASSAPSVATMSASPESVKLDNRK
jgi:hypothetical protein